MQRNVRSRRARPTRGIEAPGQPGRPEGDTRWFEDFIVADFDHRGVELAAIAVMLDRESDAVVRRIGLVPADLEGGVFGFERIG
jgi:hypothetical protein